MIWFCYNHDSDIDSDDSQSSVYWMSSHPLLLKLGQFSKMPAGFQYSWKNKVLLTREIQQLFIPVEAVAIVRWGVSSDGGLGAPENFLGNHAFTIVVKFPFWI